MRLKQIFQNTRNSEIYSAGPQEVQPTSTQQRCREVGSGGHTTSLAAQMHGPARGLCIGPYEWANRVGCICGAKLHMTGCCIGVGSALPIESIYRLGRLGLSHCACPCPEALPAIGSRGIGSGSAVWAPPYYVNGLGTNGFGVNKPMGAGLGWVPDWDSRTSDGHAAPRLAAARARHSRTALIGAWLGCHGCHGCHAIPRATSFPSRCTLHTAAHCAPEPSIPRIVRIPPMECTNPRIHELRLAKATCMVLASRARTRFSLAHSLCGVRIQVGMCVARWEMGALT